MSDIVIRTDNLGKRYRLGERQRYLAFRDVLARAVTAPARIFKARKATSPNDDPTHIWALKDVSFEIRQGEVVGIIGRNGAGKTTLLKILARVTRPTEGRAQVKGRVGSLLEVGIGFHQELTGRENIYLSGAILGMGKKEIERKFDEIVAFAEMEKFIDTPVKHYSSGMYLRLAFAVAAHLDPEILLVDEILAVGDAAFQKKCLGKMGDVAEEGRTVLFVSHSLASVVALCKTSVLLERGTVRAKGPSADVIQEYLSPDRFGTNAVDLRQHANRHGSGEARFIHAALYDEAGRPCSVFRHGDDIHIETIVESRRPSPEMIFAVTVRTILGVPVLDMLCSDDPTWTPFRIARRAKLECVLKGCPLYPGTYVVALWMSPSHCQTTDFALEVLQFRVEQGPLLSRGFEMTWQHGLVQVPSFWKATQLEDAAHSDGISVPRLRDDRSQQACEG